VILRISRNSDLTTIGEDLFPFRHRGFGVIGSLRMNRRFQDIKDTRHIAFIEHHNMIHTPKRRDKSDALVLIEDRSVVTLESPDRAIAVDRNDKHIAQLASAFQVSNVANVENVEASIRKDNFPSGHQGREFFE
jgi:hypothetical protein